MPIDIALLREQPDVVRQSQKDRFKDVAGVERAIEYDKQCRKLEFDMAQLRKERNDLTKQVHFSFWNINYALTL